MAREWCCDMSKHEQLPYLLQLLDDDSPVVREHVERELIALGPDLLVSMPEWENRLSLKQRAALHSLLSRRRAEESDRRLWRQWPLFEDESEKLETAFQLLSDFQHGWKTPIRLCEMLNNLSEEFYGSGRPMEPVSLSRFLFISKRLRGNVDDYHDPMNNNLIHVMETGLGLPITLAAIFILIGRRSGLNITGCNVPGHFLARAHVAGRDVLFDCFNGGRILSSREMAQLRATLAPNHLHLLAEPANAVMIVSRVLQNLIHAYERIGQTERVNEMRALLQDLDEVAGA